MFVAPTIEQRAPNTRRNRGLLRALGTTLMVGFAFAACGGDSPTDAPMPTVMTQDFTVQDLVTSDFFQWEFPVAVAANMAISVAWTPTEADVDVFLEEGLCFSQVCPDTNPILASGVSETANPETTAANVAAGNYTITLLNFGAGTATGTITVTLTPS
ncbi:MAG: hypothetical protein ACR2QM_03385 [Longimicrobiales bacterium]